MRGLFAPCRRHPTNDLPRRRAADCRRRNRHGGFFYAGWRADTRLAEAPPSAWEGQDIELVGIVDDLPQPADRGTRFAFAVEKILTPDAVVRSRLSLAWYNGWSAAFTPGYRHRFNHPRPEVVDRYVAAGVHNYRTDCDGALTFTLRRRRVARASPRACSRRALLVGRAGGG